MDAVGLKAGMLVGEAGAGHGFFTFKLSQRVGDRGMVIANDILPELLQYIEKKYTSRKITNIKTVQGVEDDPLFPRKNLDMIVIFDCLFEFTRPVQWMKNAKSYLKPGAKLVIVDPDPSKMGSNEDIISRKQVLDYARAAGYDPVEGDDSFLKTHMIVVLAPVSSK
jgi:ubiquinone/menaquinone biosynthesis C-methylase UbiE